MVKIRNYQKIDYPKIRAILKEANIFDEVWDSGKNLSGMVEKNPNSILVAEKDGSIVGNIFLVSYGARVLYLFRLTVKRTFRKKGIATQLINRAIKIAEEQGAVEVGLYADSDNKELLSFYKKRDFKKSKKRYYYLWKEL